MPRGCELCEGVAALYCAADKAHICWTCDAKVHSANFLVARHTRSLLCTTCATPTPWRASGANPTPHTGLCAICSQGESQGECASHVNDGTAHITRVPNSSGCSSSNSAERRDAEEDSAVRGESASQLTVNSRSSVPASVSSRISVGRPSKPGKQIATTALQDVYRSVARGQCDSTNSRRRDSQEPTCRECNRSQLPGYASAVFHSKRQRMDERAPMRPGSLPPVSASRLMRTLAKWHWDLHLSSPATVPLALRMFRKVSRALAPVVLSNAGVRVTLAACLRLAAGLDEAQVLVPKASEVAACAGVSVRRLTMTEIHLLALLGWRRFPLWAGVRS